MKPKKEPTMKKLLLASTILVVAGCSSQSPAPVVGGLFGDNYRVVNSGPVERLSPIAQPNVIESDIETVATSGYRVANVQDIEPAAGPMGVLDTEVKPKVYGTYRMTQSRDYSSVDQAVSGASTAVAELKTQNMDDIFAIKPAAGPVSAPVAPKAPAFSAPTVKTPTVAATVQPTAQAQTYKVQRGDTLYSLARQYQTTVAGLMQANSFTSSQQLVAGNMIMVPNRTPKTIAKAAVQAAAPVVTSSAQSSIEPAAGTTSSKTFNSNDVSMVEHKVAKGENLYRISKVYKVSVIDLMVANEFAIPQDLKAGSTIKVPLASSQPAVVRQTTEINQVAARAKGMVWPAKGALLSSFGQKGNGVTHTGVAIKLPENTPVMAAESGEVIYSDAGLKSYGNLVLVRHSDGLVTAYAHNNSLKVSKGDSVKKGQTIALSGATGNVATPQLHFEVRRNARAIDPTSVLPKL